MFSKLFSSKSPSEEQSKIITDFYLNYKSDTFPKGISAVTELTELAVKKDNIVLSIIVPFPCLGELAIFADKLLSEHNISVLIEPTVKMHKLKAHDIEGVCNIIAISSGKGGVGKSTTAVNIAYALMAEGARVGILDADIYGPSVPTLIGLKNAKPRSEDGKLMVPLVAHGLNAMSIGFLVDENDATVWRGPMASGAFNQLLNETAWPELDYPLIDMPPGTGDIQLTLAQKVPVAASVIVTTPQDIALIDAAKGVAMFDKVKVPVLGIVENMSYHLCENCGHKSHIFGESGGLQMAESKHTPFLGQLPLNINIRQDADEGESSLIENSTGDIAMLYRRIARNIAGQLFLQLDNTSPFTPTVEFLD